MKKSVLITGASTGIGFATAVTLQQKGFQVFACVRRPEDQDRLQKAAPGIQTLILDVTRPEEIQEALVNLESQIQNSSEFSLVNNAGIAVPGPLEALDLKDLRRQFDVNVFGLMAVTQSFLPFLREKKGRIINLSSVSGLTVSPFLGAYAASKFAVEALSDALRRELLPFGVKVVVIEPGPIDTPIWEKGLGNRGKLEQGLRKQVIPFYREAMNRFISYIDTVAKNAIPVQRVADGIFRALSEDAPPTRILIASRQDHFRTRLAQVLPHKWMDQAISKALISPK